MDRNALSINTHSDDLDAADRKRLDSFKLGSVGPRTANRRSAPILHARSHSRKDSSISSIPSAISLPYVSPISLIDTPPASPNTSATSSKRNSHHRRRSSVSTRHESAELMGVTLPAIPLSISDDNINLGDKDSIRRRALWALEGKTDVGSFAKVEIPELGGGDARKPFDFPTKPSFPPGIGAGYGSGNVLASKRDSIGKFAPSTSNKEHLHTLMEEEEEEEDTTVQDITVTSSPVDEAPATSLPSAPVRHRPASLNLRPLSLLSNTAALHNDLPTPSPSPNPPLYRAGLRTLTLATSPVPDVAKDAPSEAIPSSDVAWKRRSAVFVPSPVPASLPRSMTVNTANIQAPTPAAPAATRRGSISYFSSSGTPDIPLHGLPTPEMTPVSDRRISLSSTDSETRSPTSRPLSISEQHFLFQAHQTLVHRISDLERALSARPRSRPPSCASDVSSQSEAVSDEMLQLIADLKSERDELKRDVDGWRNRVADSEKQMSLLFRRVENERREAWVARERVGLMEAEKRLLENTLKEKCLWGEDGWAKYQVAHGELEKAREKCESLRADARKGAEDREECARLKALLDTETRKREDLERELEGVLATPTPMAFQFHSKPGSSTSSRTMAYAKRGGLGFRSIDSVGSFTDVESVGSIDHTKMNLKVVHEEDEGDSRDETMSDCSNEDNGLTGYEDEEDNDHYAFQDSSSSSSLGSVADFSTTPFGVNVSSDSVPPLSTSRSSTASPARPASPSQPIVHARQTSLSKWTFPQDNGNYSSIFSHGTENDRFFNCLEDLDDSPPMASLDSGKTWFSQALARAEDELPPFVLPAGFGVEVQSPLEIEAKTSLDVVVEEEEELEEDESIEEEESSFNPDDEFVGQEVEGGIIFTFNVPEPERETPDLSHDTSSTPDSSFSDEHSHSLSTVSSSSIASPSSIPRLVGARKSLLPSALPMSSTPVKASRSMDSIQTPPSPSCAPIKWGMSPAEMRRSASPSTPSRLPQPSFIPQPRRNSTVKPASSKYATTSPKQSPSILDDPFASESSISSPQSSIPLLYVTAPNTTLHSVVHQSCPLSVVVVAQFLFGFPFSAEKHVRSLFCISFPSQVGFT
ncbi:hypothetical protein EUX98_g474 [Antrodiella citrinella]|uniref:Uncharacterized protein n=1 Tax=Antrodiella citrinella TaxID=2447956 RepID=A0A4V3XJN4_9APHY|nr:hypothetical protein EUX98_g474 [Antrodiella citrinella]